MVVMVVVMVVVITVLRRVEKGHLVGLVSALLAMNADILTGDAKGGTVFYLLAFPSTKDSPQLLKKKSIFEICIRKGGCDAQPIRAHCFRVTHRLRFVGLRGRRRANGNSS